jgi:hypothetical protein
MDVGICKTCGIERTLKSKKNPMCGSCYQRLKRTGTTDKVRMPRGMCTVPDCDKKAHGRGLCDMHIRRMRVSGNFDDPRADNVNLMTNQKLYAQWSNYQRSDAYPIVEEWKKDFFTFMDGVGERPSAKHRLYRIDKTQPLGPGNFQWRERLVERHNEETDEEYNRRHQKARRTVYGVGMWNSDLQSKYGFGLRKLREMAEAQGHKCAICRQPETEMRNGIVRHLSVDHDHATGKVRGLLCTACNTGIGKFKDDTDLLALAIAYLLKHRVA